MSGLPELRRRSLDQVANDCRAAIRSAVDHNGGHLSSNLGCVELTIALHRVFPPTDHHLVWDVGHQAYTHKLLTGRAGRFHTVRMRGGLSGFTNSQEGPCDVHSSGHAGTAISYAIGLCQAIELSRTEKEVIAIVGDGAFCSPLSLEGLVQASQFGKRLIIVLNDNQHSIAPTGIVLAPMFERLRLRQSTPSFFHEIGVDYVGPLDGHNVDDLIHEFEALKETCQRQRPTLVHVVTRKGKGSLRAENDPVKYHFVAPQIRFPDAPVSKRKALTPVFARWILEKARVDERIVAICAGMPTATGLEGFASEFPRRFFDVGIAEEFAVTLASGLSYKGFLPIVAVHSTFLQRAYDQVFHDVCLQNRKVVFFVDKGSLSGTDGPSHHGVYDIALFSHLPNVALASPRDGDDLTAMLDSALESVAGPIMIRVPRRCLLDHGYAPPRKPAFGRYELIRPPVDGLLVTYGPIFSTGLETCRLLERDDIRLGLANLRFLKPLDPDLIALIGRISGLTVFTLEEHALIGGMGQFLAAQLSEAGICAPIKHFGIPDRFITWGKHSELLEDLGLTPPRLAREIGALIRCRMSQR